MNSIFVGRYATTSITSYSTISNNIHSRAIHSLSLVVQSKLESCSPQQQQQQQQQYSQNRRQQHQQKQQQLNHRSQSFLDHHNLRQSYRSYSSSTTCMMNRSSTGTNNNDRHGTTIICVRKNGKVCMIGDSMVSQGNMIVKPNAIKIRKIMPKGSMMTSTTTADLDAKNDDGTPRDVPNITLVGFAGSTADAFTLMERLENKLDEYPGQLMRSCVELAKGWRTDKYLRRLDAALLVANSYQNFELTGNGDVLEPHDGILGIGSGSPYAIAAARALIDIPELSAEDVALKAMNVASDMCIYTNKRFTIEILDAKVEEKAETTE